MNIGDPFSLTLWYYFLRNLGKETMPTKMHLRKNILGQEVRVDDSHEIMSLQLEFAWIIGSCLAEKKLISKANPKGFFHDHVSGGVKPIILTPKGDENMAYVSRYFWTLKEATLNQKLESPNLNQ